MRLISALINREEQLGRLAALRSELLKKPDHRHSAGEQAGPRAGAIRAAVIEVLTAAVQPVRVKDVRVAVEVLLHERVFVDTINSCLSTGARGDRALFERTAYGEYRLA